MRSRSREIEDTSWAWFSWVDFIVYLADLWVQLMWTGDVVRRPTPGGRVWAPEVLAETRAASSLTSRRGACVGERVTHARIPSGERVARGGDVEVAIFAVDHGLDSPTVTTVVAHSPPVATIFVVAEFLQRTRELS